MDKQFFAAWTDCTACAKVYPLIDLQPYWIVIQIFMKETFRLSPKMLLIRAASSKSNTKLLIKAEFSAFHKSVIMI